MSMRGAAIIGLFIVPPGWKTWLGDAVNLFWLLPKGPLQIGDCRFWICQSINLRSSASKVFLHVSMPLWLLGLK